MTLKQRLALYLSMAFALLFGMALLFIYFSFASFRTQEFADRLEEQALTTVRLLLKIKEVDRKLLKTIDRNSLHKLYNEKTLVFDHNFRLIYSSIDDASVKWNIEDLKELRAKHTFFRQNEDKELLGLHYEANTDYYVIIAAEDKYGFSKLRYLTLTLLSAFVIGSLVVWLITYGIVVKLVKPLDQLQKTIADITIHELNTQLPEHKSKDEINLLSKSFNQMLRRIERAYNAQKEFTSNASHELRTPITRLSVQLDNLLRQPHSEATTAYLHSMTNDINQMSELVHSLLLLARMNRADLEKQLQQERIDEVLFGAYEKTKKQFPDFQMNFEIADNDGYIPNLEVHASKSLLEIAFFNLLKNAYLYADSHTVMVKIYQMNEKAPLSIDFVNTGLPLDPTQEDKIFEPFMRGSNAQSTTGSGLGLRIAKRILNYHHASIGYEFVKPNLHKFVLRF